jgi:hypothetical protein
MKNCINCGEQFEEKKYNGGSIQVYCSVLCRKNFYSSNMKSVMKRIANSDNYKNNINLFIDNLINELQKLKK